MADIDLNDFEEFMVADFAPLNRPYTLTITGASVVKTYDRKSNQEQDIPALHFRETKKKMKLTSSDNRHTLGRLYGSKSSGWIGKPIVVRVIEKKIFGEMKRYFIIDPVVPQPKLTTATPLATNHLPSALGPEFSQMLDLALALNEADPTAAVTSVLVECGNDAVAALEVFKARYTASQVGMEK